MKRRKKLKLKRQRMTRKLVLQTQRRKMTRKNRIMKIAEPIDGENKTIMFLNAERTNK